MDLTPVCNETLIARLPLPLARLYRRTHNAKTAHGRHNPAFYLWEACIKLVASVAVADYAALGVSDPKFHDTLATLRRPTLGQWMDIVRTLIPRLGEAIPHYREATAFLFRRSHTDCPNLIELDTRVRAANDAKGIRAPRPTIACSSLLSEIIRYRNGHIGHAANGLKSDEFYAQMGAAFLAGFEEFCERFDPLVGRRLVYVDAVARLSATTWRVERLELTAESARRMRPQERAHDEWDRLPVPGQIYLIEREGSSSGSAEAAGEALPRVCLHPFVVYSAQQEDIYFWNGLSGSKSKTLDLLCYAIDAKDRIRVEIPPFLAEILESGPPSLPEPGVEAPSSAVEPTKTEQSDIAAAREKIGDFELHSLLGKGSMGEVFKAWQTSVGRFVALKRLFRSGESALKRFDTEVQALTRVDHPNLVKVFQRGSDSGTSYFVMELVEGATLAAVAGGLRGRGTSAGAVDLTAWRDCLEGAVDEVRRTEKPDETALSDVPSAQALAPVSAPRIPSSVVADRDYVRHIVELMRQVATAAHALHEARVVHRDIKPGNIMVAPDGNRAVLMDLGLAKMVDGPEASMTLGDGFVGTWRYASPEQAGRYGVDRRSDVYSLGVTLWEMLTLRPIYGSDESMPLQKLLQKIQQEDPERLRKYHPGIPRDLEAIVARCVEKKPDRRYATAAELADDLSRYLEGRPVWARPVTGLERAVKWMAREKLKAGMAVAVALVGLTLPVAGILYKKAKDEAEHRATAERLKVAAESARGEAERLRLVAETARREAEKQKDAADAARVQIILLYTRSSSTIEKIVDMIRDQMAADLTTRETYRKVLAVALDHYRATSDEMAGHSELGFDPATQVQRLAQIYEAIGDYSRAAEVYLRAIQLRERANPGAVSRVGTRDTSATDAEWIALLTLSDCYHERGIALERAGKSEFALDAFKKGLTIREYLYRDGAHLPIGRADDLLVALGRSHGYLGDIYYYNARKRDDLDDAKQHYEKSESFRDKLVKLTPPDDPMYLEYLFQQARGKLNLAALARVTGDTEAALSKCNTGVDIQRQVCEAMESRPGQDRSHQAKYLSDLGYGRMLRSTLLREQRLAQAGVKTTSDAQELSDLTVASKALERAVRLIPGCAEYVINRTRSLVALGNARLELGDPQGAQNAYDEVMEVFNRHLMNEGESIANANPLATDDHDARNALAKAYLLRARLYRQVGDQNEALKFLGKAEPIAKSLFEESREHEIKSDYCEILAERGDLLAQLGRVDEGCELIKQAYTIQSDLCEVVSGMSLYRVRLGRFSEAMTRWENQRVATAAPKGQ